MCFHISIQSLFDDDEESIGNVDRTSRQKSGAIADKGNGRQFPERSAGKSFVDESEQQEEEEKSGGSRGWYESKSNQNNNPGGW